ncbi:hypothetical protein [Paraburkholderia phenazinium]|jgi:hypothetical protein|uniref:hypothetical protein n=1 Tax=Paraburkholderia phenazinium TaxID=60549 RepID=UPI000B85AE48|nr:hypothetical protein [Paraburkholderia phenazinium]
MSNDFSPEGAEIDRAMIPKVPGCNKKSACAGAHRPLVTVAGKQRTLASRDGERRVGSESL